MHGARRKAISLIEVLLGLVVLGVVLYALISLLTSGRKMEDTFGSHLGLQLDAQRSLMQLIRDLQEGITVVQPAPGSTLPHAVVRDKLNRLVFFSLVPSGPPGAPPEYRLRRDLATPTGTTTTYLIGGIQRMTFSALSDSALMLHVILGSGPHRYAFHTQVRLRNRDAAEVD